MTDEAGDRGIEPRARVLETPMLPLHQSPSAARHCRGWGRTMGPLRAWWNGQHAGFRCRCRKAWGFESLRPHSSQRPGAIRSGTLRSTHISIRCPPGSARRCRGRRRAQTARHGPRCRSRAGRGGWSRTSGRSPRARRRSRSSCGPCAGSSLFVDPPQQLLVLVVGRVLRVASAQLLEEWWRFWRSAAPRARDAPRPRLLLGRSLPVSGFASRLSAPSKPPLRTSTSRRTRASRSHAAMCSL